MSPPLMKLKTVLGNGLRFRSLSAREEMARLFEFDVLALSGQAEDVDTAALIGTDAVVTFALGKGGERHFHGIVASAGLESTVGRFPAWRLQLRPWLWRLTQRSDNRIFQDLSVPDILKKVFEKYVGDVSFELQGTFTPRPYCVQYGETDFNFVSRLMEEEGIYYFHRHSAAKHQLVICNAMTAHSDFPSYATLKYRQTQDQGLEFEAVTDWRHRQQMSSGKVTLTDYDYLKPPVSLMTDHASVHSTAPAALERYEHPGYYTDKGRGSGLARVRQQEHDAGVLRIFGGSASIAAISAGYRFSLEDHPLGKENTAHVVLATQIDAQFSGYESDQGETTFNCRFEAMRYAHVFRPARLTPRALIPGPQTAVVVGPAGEEIFTDEHGRVKVQFHWDRLGQKNDRSSCWIRVATPWAGRGWGAISLPRIGHEVVVEFLEGNPDLPLITGSVYNAQQVPPFKLPDNKTVSTLRSQSSMGGNTSNANELRFEDKKGSEYIWFQAERDMQHLVKRNAQTLIRGNLDHTVGGNVNEKVEGQHHREVGAFHRFKVGGDCSSKIGGAYAMDVTGFYQLKSGDAIFECKRTAFQSSEWHQIVDGVMKIKADDVFALKAMSVAIEATTKISLKVGGNFVVIDMSGVSINGTLVNVNSGGMADAAQAPRDVDPSPLSDPQTPERPDDPLSPAA